MATLQQEQVRGGSQGNAPEALEINDFMLKMIEVLNKRFGAVNQQMNELSGKSAEKTALAELRTRTEKEKEALLARLTLLESELSALKNSLKPPEPKVNKNILKHLE